LSVCSERIHFLGHKEEPWPYYMGLDICVLASLKNEGVPQTLLKAMRANTLVLGTNVGGIPEIVFNHKTGVLVEPNDKKSLTVGLGELLNKSDDHKILLKNANDLSLRYAWRNIGQLTIDSFLTPNIELLSSSRESVHGFFPERKRNVIILAHHSSWGAAANFREMFSFDNQYSVIEINHDSGSKNEYNFGEGKSGESITIDNISFVENLFNDPDSIVFLFDYLGIKLFEKVCKLLNISRKSLPLNIFWSGNPFIKNRAFCLNWAKKYSVREYAMLDLLRLANNALPLMQPYDLKKLVATKSNAKSDNIIRICHSPGHKGNNNEKGTKSIQSAINELKIDFKNIEYVLLGGDKWVDNAECLKIKSTCDIFIDKVGKETAGGIGKSGIESICFGIPTISSTHMSNFEGRYSELRVLSADTYDDLINNLRKLISDADYYNKCKSETIVSRDVFCYEKTLSYLEQTMNQ